MLLSEIVGDDRNIAYIPSLGTSYRVNESAREIIELIREGRSKDEIIQLFAKSTGKNWRDIYIDVDDFFKKLKIYGLL